MPYAITTKDGITLRGIPDDVPKDSEQLKARVAAIRAGRGAPAAIPPVFDAGPAGLPAERPAAPEPGMLDKVIGAGETALAATTGAVGGTLGMLGGAAGALAGAVLSGDFGTQQAAALVEQAAAEGARKLTYEPRTPAGQEMTASLGEVAQNLVPLAGVAGTLGPAGALATPARAITDTAKAVPGVVADTALAARQALTREAPAATPGTLGSAGAAGTDIALQRRTSAESLPVPIKLTEGQATRDQAQLRFENESAKGTAGARIRERYADQNQQVVQNFERFIDDTGATAPSLLETGRTVVDEGLRPIAARKKTEYRAKYKEAEKAGELAADVDLQPLADYLNTQRAGRTSAPILQVIADELGVQGVGGGSLADGTVAVGRATLKQAEEIRKAVNRFAKQDDPNDMRIGSGIKEAIDSATEGAGGQLYKEARGARRRYAQLFEDNAVVSDLLRAKRGTEDRQVALENVFNRTIQRGTREDLSNLRRTLQVDGSPEGAQAWKELQGATVRHIADEATKGVGLDVRGNPIVSAAKMHSAIQALEKGGKLEFVLGKRGAQQIRDLDDLARVMYTVPPGTINTSNTASVILAALAEAGTTGAITGLPVPVLSGLKALSTYAKNRRLEKQIDIALDGKRTVH